MRRKNFNIYIGVTLLFSAVFLLQLLAAHSETFRFARERRHPAADEFRPMIGVPGRMPPVPLLIIALSDTQLQLSGEQKTRLRHALPMPPKSPRQDTTPSLIAPIRSLQAAEWKLIRDVLTPQQLETFLHRLASMRIFRMLRMKLQTLLFSSSTPTTPEVKRIGDAPAAIPMMSALIVLAIYTCLPQNAYSVFGKIRLQHLRVLRL